MQTATLASLIVLLIAWCVAAGHSLWWLVRNRRRREQPAAGRAQLQRWALDWGLEPRRFETSRHLRARLSAAMHDPRAIAGRSDRAVGTAARA